MYIAPDPRARSTTPSEVHDSEKWRPDIDRYLTIWVETVPLNVQLMQRSSDPIQTMNPYNHENDAGVEER